jgi:hypothetical protein
MLEIPPKFGIVGGSPIAYFTSYPWLITEYIRTSIECISNFTILTIDQDKIINIITPILYYVLYIQAGNAFIVCLDRIDANSNDIVI